jgi:hypothetical protein
MITGMPLVPGLAPVTNSSATAAIQSSNDNAVTSASGALNPVIINNNVSNSGGGSSATPRVSGAVSTAPVGSHLDRSLYGDYGAGYP